MNHKQLLALFLCFVILLSPVIVSIEKDKVVNVKKVNENLDDFSIESIIREENNTKINVFYPVTKCTKANNFIQEKIDYYIQKIQETYNKEILFLYERITKEWASRKKEYTSLSYWEKYLEIK